MPITPGVTGISLQVSERDDLIEKGQSSGSIEQRLVNALASGIAHNVLSLRLTDRKRDENRVIFYVNRLLCPAFELPLGFGGYKPTKATVLSEWMDTYQETYQLGLEIG